MTMNRYFLGVDTGGTKTHALIANEAGELVGFGKAGPGNHEVVGYDGVKAALQESVGHALEMAALHVEQISGAGFGVAGYDWASELPDTLDAISVLGLKCAVEAVNDMVIGLVAGAREGWGIVIDAGTGTNCRGLTRDGREGMVTGCGSAFGEHGGAYDLVQAAVIAVNHHWIRRGAPTALSDAFIEYFHATDLTDLIEGLTQGRYAFNGELARLVFKVAQAGDPVATEIIRWTGCELGEQICAIIRQLSLEKETFEVVQIGSLFKGGALLVNPMQEFVHRMSPGAQFTHLSAPPVVGGVMLGMQQAGLDFRPLRQAIIAAACQADQA